MRALLSKLSGRRWCDDAPARLPAAGTSRVSKETTETQRHREKKFLKSLSLCVSVVISLLWSFSGTAAALDPLTILSPHWEGARYEFEHGFSTWYRQRTGRDVQVIWLDVGGTSEIIRFVLSEYEQRPDGIAVDLVYGGGNDPYREFARRGLLVSPSLDASVKKAIPETAAGTQLVDPHELWYGTAMTAFGIVCNQVVLDRLKIKVPQTWSELGEPSLNGWVGAADPRKSGGAHKLYEIILQAYGWEKGWSVIRALGRNVRAFSPNSAEVPKDVANGETACGLSFDSYAWPHIRELGSDAIRFVLPKGLTLVDADGIGILRGAPHLQTARLFVEYALSEAGQKLWLYKPGVPGGPTTYELARLSVLPSLYTDLGQKSNVTLEPFGWQPSFQFDNAKAARRYNILNELIGIFVIEQRVTENQTVLPSAAPVSEAEVREIAESGKWDDPLFRAELLTSWRLKAEKEAGGSGDAIDFKVIPLLLVLAGVGVAGLKKIRKVFRRFKGQRPDSTP